VKKLLLSCVGAAALPLALAACCTEPVYEGMIFVPAAEFKVGTEVPEAEADEKPAKTVKLEKGFHIDVHEVTNKKYHEFITKTGRKAPPHWPGGVPPKGEEEFPVTNITYFDADAYAKHHQKRLPTEQEWELAARGTDGRLYPWGNEMKDDVSNSFGAKNAPGRPVAVNDARFQGGKSPYGLWHMAGNVWEWTATTAAGTGEQLVKGGSFDIAEGQPRASKKRPIPADQVDDRIGFRTAKDATCD